MFTKISLVCKLTGPFSLRSQTEFSSARTSVRYVHQPVVSFHAVKGLGFKWGYSPLHDDMGRSKKYRYFFGWIFTVRLQYFGVHIRLLLWKLPSLVGGLKQEDEEAEGG